MAVDHSWHDPLLITDVTHQQNSHYPLFESLRSQSLTMADPGDSFPAYIDDISWGNPDLETNHAENFSDQIAGKVVDGRSMLRFSLTSPDLVICTGSPDIPPPSYEVSPNLLKGTSIELSLENGIEGSTMQDSTETPVAAARNLTLWRTSMVESHSEASFELLPPPLAQYKSEHLVPILGINAGSTNGAAIADGIMFLEDDSFSGGDVIRTDTKIGDGEGLSLYQTARFGNFEYHFKTLESGNYLVDLHLAEIVFTEGPPGMRVFDVFLQEQKVVSSLDIYARVGGNKPLVISDLKTYVHADEGLYIRFDGMVGIPILCGISIKKDSSPSTEGVELLKVGLTQVSQCDTPKVEEEFRKLQVEYESQKKELKETSKALEALTMENERKTRECQAALKSLQELQNELMRKSMHVGSLAFAVEGQVKEKSRWFSSLRDMTRKLKIMKLEHIQLSEEALSYKKCMDDMCNVTSMIQSRVNQQMKLHEDLKIKFMNGARERKELYNKILELKGNIRVFCRCRPLNSEEIAEGASVAFDFEAAKDGELTVRSNASFKRSYKFDAVFSPQANQGDVFEDTTPFATSVLDGYNVCIFAYGQTGTGKTYTMEGTDESRGVNFRTLEELFRVIDERKNQVRYEICVSALEVYNEQIRDLLVPNSQQGVSAKRLEIRQVAEGVHHVPGLVEAHVSNMNEVWEVLKTGSNARAVGSTNANEHSSRSHCIHCVMVKGENLLNGECTRSKLWLVDLAGSERVAKTEVQGERLKETQNINRSLSALGDVISALATKSPHVPFRNSKLTHLLQDSLGGDSKTLMFVQISPNENDLSESLCSLNFASRVRGIELGPAKRQLDSTELVKYKQMVEKTKHDIKSKDMQIKKMEETIHGLDMKVKEKDLKNKNLQDKIKELESQLLIERKLARQHVDTKIAEQQQQMRQQQEDAVARPPLATKPFGTHKNFNEDKDPVNIPQLLAENNAYKTSTTLPTIVRHNDATEKENIPDLIEQLPLPNRAGRASLCTTVHRLTPFTSSSAPRRNSLIPLPSALGSARFTPPLLPLTPILDAKREDENEIGSKGIPEPSTWDSPKENNSGGKKLNSKLRRSIQKKIQMKLPMQQHIRRGGVNVEKVRVSIGSRGRMGYRGMLGSGRKVTKDNQQKPNQRDKERRWNMGTGGRTLV